MSEIKKISYQNFVVKVILLFVLSLFLSSEAFSQNNDTIRKDKNSDIQIRSSLKINTYLNDSDFLYDTEPGVSPQTLWQRIWFWIVLLISDLFYFLGKGGNLTAYIFYGLMLFLLVFIILKLMGLSPHHLLMKSRKIHVPDIPVFDDDINAVNFDKIISESVSAEDYRKATRFLYIKFLKLLSENEFIEWKREKTNTDYKREMKNNKYSDEFSYLTKIYEYVWYGEFSISKKFFFSENKRFNRVFNDFE
ncbi:MAG: hypothetical protein GXO80_04470 [Chlorobi bacterium]|nr:hypothetical protein [Chlorobiota bacterium]